MKTKKPWTTLKIVITIQSDDERRVFDVNYSDGYRSISYDGEPLPTLKQILEDFDY